MFMVLGDYNWYLRQGEKMINRLFVIFHVAIIVILILFIIFMKRIYINMYAYTA